MLRRGFQTAGVLQLRSSVLTPASPALIDSSLIFRCLPSLRLGPCWQDSWLTPLSSPSLLRSICLRGELRSRRYFQDAACRLWLHCPHITSSCTLWLCRMLLHTSSRRFNTLCWILSFHLWKDIQTKLKRRIVEFVVVVAHKINVNRANRS